MLKWVTFWLTPAVALISRSGVAIALLVTYSARRSFRPAIVIATILLAALDLALAGGGAVNRMTNADHWQQLSAGAQYILAADPSQTTRFYAIATSDEDQVVAGLKHYYPSLYHLPGTSGHSSLRLLRYDTFMQQAHSWVMLALTGTKFVLHEKTLNFDPDAVLTLEFQALEQADDWYVYTHPSVLPRAFVMRRALAAANEEQVLSYLRERRFDPRRLLLLEADEPLPPLSPDIVGQDKVVITSYRSSSVDIEVDLAAPGFLVLTDNYYPGWQVYVDGEREPIWRAYYFARAVYVPGGGHTIQFVYRPASFWGGVSLAVSGLLIMAVVGWLTWRKRKVYHNSEQ